MWWHVLLGALLGLTVTWVGVRWRLVLLAGYLASPIDLFGSRAL